MTGTATGRSVPRLVVVHPDATVLARATAARLLTRILDVQSVRSTVHVVLTGGTVGIATLAEVAADPVRDAVDWAGVHVWWGDERFLPDGDPDRNETQARAALLDALPTLPPGNVHVVPALSSEVTTPEDAAARYAATLAEHAPDGADAPVFDVLLLGMGPDAHVASLFPGHEALDVRGVAAVGVHGSPKPPPERVSLTFETICAAAEVWVVAAGAEKADAVSAALGGASTHDAPAGAVRGVARTLWLLDVAAAGGTSSAR
ncbi:6-phosphogluconolactonase [Oerskovia flava]|uniref:6-phosphogluconolactonase n=1 Tax=Oerskovia flava TaxID=2986422 RepID=UPI00223F3A24|nr:6-phosphogluconolactonase [Oerskovia sp. JB1-3-2]